MAGDDRHGHGAGVPAGSGEAAEMGLGRFLVAEVERLRIIFARELQHFLARHVVVAEDGLVADVQIVEIDHAALIAGLGRQGKWQNETGLPYGGPVPSMGRFRTYSRGAGRSFADG